MGYKKRKTNEMYDMKQTELGSVRTKPQVDQLEKSWIVNEYYGIESHHQQAALSADRKGQIFTFNC